MDDILDVEGDTATLGKTQGKDADANKPTYVKLMGLEGAKAEAGRLLGRHWLHWKILANPRIISRLARYIVERDVTANPGGYC